jgi:hypothetical protein
LENKFSIGKTYKLADDDGMTWGEFYGYFAHHFDMTFRTEPQAYSEERSKDRGRSANSGKIWDWLGPRKSRRY